MMNKGVTDAYPDRQFYFTIVISGSTDVHMPKIQKFVEFMDADKQKVLIEDG